MPRYRDEEDEDYEQEEEEQVEEEEVEEEEVEEEEVEEPPEEEEEEEEHWRWSTCQGTKKALFIGINYFGSGGQLNGCINDVHNIHSFLHDNYGYDEAHVRILTDDQEDPELQPTKNNVIAGMQWLVEDAQPDDALFLHYSGHGGQEIDHDGDEADGYDECICPVDYEESGVIVDDLIHELVVKPLPVGCRLTAIFDACHSGTGIDLPYTYTEDGCIKEPGSQAEVQERLREAFIASQEEGGEEAVYKSTQAIQNALSGRAQEAHEKTKATKTSHADAIFLSGCKDIQTSADASVNGEATGALSHAFVAALTEDSELSYHDLLHRIREILVEQGHSQIPQLSSSHEIDTSLTFIC